MIISFMFFYLIGSFVFFCHLSIVTIMSTKEIASRKHMTEEKKEQLFITYFARILFQTVIMTIFPLSFAFYVKMNSWYSNELLVSSGLFMILWLMLTGVVIKLAYYIVTNKIKALKQFEYDAYFQDKEFFWITCPILYGALFSIYDYKILFYILAIVLGKYIWMDSFDWSSLKKISKKVAPFFKKSKPNIYLLLYQAAIMGYLLLRWYPVRDESMDIMYTINTFVLLALFLMPMLDLLIFQSLNTYSGFIIESRK